MLILYQKTFSIKIVSALLKLVEVKVNLKFYKFLLELFLKKTS